MKYHYCPICGEALPPKHRGKYCKECAAKERKKKLLRTAICMGVAVGVGAITVTVVSAKKKVILEYITDAVKEGTMEKIRQLPAQGLELLQQTGSAAQSRTKDLLTRIELPANVSPDLVKEMLRPKLEKGQIRIIEMLEKSA